MNVSRREGNPGRMGKLPWLLIPAALTACIPAAILLGQAVNSGQVQSEPLTKPRDPAHELALKINGSFTLAAVGD